MSILNPERHDSAKVPDHFLLSKVLVVDDDSDVIRAVLLQLRKEGFEAKGCTTGTEALSIIEEETFGIIVIDLRLPDIQGPQLVKRLLEKTRSLKAIIHTGFGSFESIKETINYGAFAFVEKCDDPHELIRQVHRAAESRLHQYMEELEGVVAQQTGELREQKQWLESLIKSVHGVIWEYDLRTVCFTYISEQIEPLFGYPAQEWITNPALWQDLLHPEDHDWVVAFCDEATTWQSNHEFEYRMIAKDGGVIWIYDLVTVVVEHNRPVKLRGVMIDITERKRTEEALRESEANYHDLYDHAPDMMVSVDPHTASILQCNETLATATGYSKEEIIGRPVFDMYHPDSLENARQYFKTFQETGTIHNAELQLKRKDGSMIDVMLNVTAVRDDQGRILSSLSIWRDITEYKQAKRENAKQQLLVNLMLTTGPGCIKRVAADGTLLSMNPAGLQFIEADSEQEAVGRSIFDLILPEHLPAFESLHREVLQGKTQTLQCEIQGLKGTRRWMETYAAPFYNPISRENEHLAVTHDITERKNIEAQLDGIIHSAMDGIITMNDQQEVIIFNTAAEKMFGYSAKEALGQPITKFIPERYRECHSHDVKRFGEFGETMRVRGSLGCVVGLHANGKEFPLDASISKLERGAHRFYTVILRDVTERKKAEEALRRFEQIVSSSRSMLALIDRDYRYLAVNQQYVHMFDVPHEYFLGRTMGEMVGQEHFERVSRPHVDRCLAGELVTFKTWLTFPNGAQRYLDIQLSPYRDEHQAVQGFVVEARDITTLHHLEEQVRRSQKLEAIGTLSAGIAHDFNNILTAILGFGELAAIKVAGNQPVQQNLAQIMKAGKRAKDLVRQILLFSRQTEPSWKPVDVRMVVQETIRFLRASIPSTIEISHNSEADSIPIMVKGDATQLEQVIMNLGANAEHAMRSRGGQLDIMLHSVELDPAILQSHPQLDPGWYARLTIRDTGIGIVRDVLPNIFDPFFTTKAVNEGTGLGLSVVHGIVIAHGGIIMVDSTLGQGTTFIIYLPQDSHPPEEGDREGREVPRPELSGKILVVDDEEPLVKLTEELLCLWGYEVVAFTEPMEAIKAFRADPEKFAVVITDQTMPRKTGEEVIRELLAIRPNLPIILCSGYSYTMNANKARSIGATAFLMKPFQVNDLLSALRTALNSGK